MTGKIIYLIGFVFLLALSLYSAFHLVPYFLEQHRERLLEEELSVLLREDQEQAFRDLLALNGDFVGWLRIDGTGIDYPVVQTTDNEYYLERNFYKETSRYGTLFVDSRCSLSPPGDHLIIYGHHMKDGSMFGELMNYGDRSFYEAHRILRFNTLSEKADYEIISVFRADAGDERMEDFFSFIDPVDAAGFEARMAYLKSVSLYETGVSAAFGDRLLTLATCEYSSKNGRLVVMARKV